MKDAASPAAAHLGELIRDLRHKTSMSRKLLAELSALDISHIARLESGVGNPTVNSLIQLATAFDVSPTIFVEGLTAADLPEDIRPRSNIEYRRTHGIDDAS